MESPGKEEPDVEAVSPCKRWYRYAKPGGGAAGLVAKGSFKEVYKGFDREFGREVAWNVVNTEHSNRVDQVSHHALALHVIRRDLCFGLVER
jgi:hypothetical protein